MDELRGLAQIDLNLLTVFRAVDETRHVTKAAALLGVSQPALSHALRRLRAVFNDALFVKTARGMVLTPLAERLAGPIRAALRGLAGDVFGRAAFQLEALARTFRVRTTDLIESLLTAPLLAAAERRAPGVRIATTAAGYALPKSELEAGTVDLAIAGFFGTLPDGFFQQRLYTDTYLAAVRRGHPRGAALRRGALAAYCAERHLLISPSGDLTGTVDVALRKLKRARDVASGVSGFLVAGWVCAHSDNVLTGPARLLRQLEAYLPLLLFPPPLELPAIKIAQVWHARNHEDPGHQWFRELVRSVLR